MLKKRVDAQRAYRYEVGGSVNMKYKEQNNRKITVSGLHYRPAGGWPPIGRIIMENFDLKKSRLYHETSKIQFTVR
jgi:hypothetical protein